MSSSEYGVAVREHLLVGFPDLGPSELQPTVASGEAALIVMRPSVARFLVREPAVRQGEDPDAVHDMRVAARRIRTALRLFRGYVRDDAAALSEELRWIASLLGDVRDNDVRRRWLASSSNDIGAEEKTIIHALDDLFAARRAQAQTIVVEALDSNRFRELRAQLVVFARAPGIATDAAMRPIADVAPSLVAKRHKAMRRAGRTLGPESEAAELHRLRIRAKRARYAIEFFEPIYGKPAESLTRRIVRLQDLLGELHDDELTTQRLRELADGAGEALPEGSAFVLGELAERASRRVRKLRRRFPDTFRGVRGRRWKELKKAMAERTG